jgi:hypothetical protein
MIIIHVFWSLRYTSLHQQSEYINSHLTTYVLGLSRLYSASPIQIVFDIRVVWQCLELLVGHDGPFAGV